MKYDLQYQAKRVGSTVTSVMCNIISSSVIASFTSTQPINQSCIFTVVQVTKSLQDPLEVGNNLPGISDNVRERGMEQKCFQTLTEG